MLKGEKCRNERKTTRLGKDRSAATSEEFKAILNDLDGVLNPLVRRIRKAVSDYDANKA
jgi:DNA repair protein RadD